jgi:hypothetical protein
MTTENNIWALHGALEEILKYIDPKYKWVAMDAGGEFYCYTDKPHLSSFDWWNSHGQEGELSLNLPYDGPWEESLVELWELK